MELCFEARKDRLREVCRGTTGRMVVVVVVAFALLQAPDAKEKWY